MSNTSHSLRLRRASWLLAPVALATMALAACTPPPAPDPTTPWLPAGCIDSSFPGVPDFDFNGIANQFENAAASFIDGAGTYSTDGSCGGTFGEEKGTIVRGADSTAAIAACDSAGVSGLTDPARLVDFGYEAPVDAWTCIDAPASS